MIETIEYIIKFILGDHVDADIAKMVAYTNDDSIYSNYKIVIKPSSFFDESFYLTQSSLPQLPLKIWEETPILYGEDKVEMHGETTVLHADIVASTFFLVSRYEEEIRKKTRDFHGRFPGKESLPYRAGFIDRPLIDEYGVLLRELLRSKGVNVPEPEKQIRKLYLTHDVDKMAHYRHVRGLIGGVLRGIKRPSEARLALKTFFGSLRNDPWYTFPYLFKLDTDLIYNWGVQRCEAIVFVRSSGQKRKEDKPFVNQQHPDYKSFIRYCKRKAINIGLHCSFEAGMQPELISEEKKKLEKVTRTKIYYNRHHYLNAREPQDMQSLIDAGIKHDFSMGYADMAGFRLGTCRPVKWIELKSKKVMNLTLHGLTIMDVSLSDKRYMYMNAHDAQQYCFVLIDTVERYGGEISLLWHNTSVVDNNNSYHRELYKEIIQYLNEKAIGANNQ